MKKEERLRSLTWKYFWEQKWEEVRPTIRIIYIVSFWVATLITLAAIANHSYTEFNKLAIVYLGLHIFVDVFCSFEKWIKSNWKKAKRRARKDLK